MSSKLVGRALEIRGLSKAEKLIFIGLADCSNTATGACFPAIAWLSKVAEVSERHAVRCIKALESLRLIRVDRHPGRSSDYILFPSGYPLLPSDMVSGPTPDAPSDLTSDMVSDVPNVTPDIAMSEGARHSYVRVTGRNQKKKEHAREDLDERVGSVAELRQRLRDGHHHWRPGGPDGKCGECDLVVSDHAIEEQEVPA